MRELIIELFAAGINVQAATRLPHEQTEGREIVHEQKDHQKP
jgi:hypothetical protein